MSLSKKLRFEIFERDGFCCQYCGKKPPETVLHVDHIVSKKDGGDDDVNNLICSCIDCNLGKSSKSLPKSPSKYKKQIKNLEEKTAQLESFYEFLKKKSKNEIDRMNVFQKAWEEGSEGQSSLTDSGLESITRLLKKHTAEEIFESIKITWQKKWDKSDQDSQFPYMCGILKNMRLKKENPEKFELHKKAYSVRATIRGSCYGYINDQIFWKWVNDGIDLDLISEKAIELSRWSDLSNFIHNNFYE